MNLLKMIIKEQMRHADSILVLNLLTLFNKCLHVIFDHKYFLGSCYDIDDVFFLYFVGKIRFCYEGNNF